MFILAILALPLAIAHFSTQIAHTLIQIALRILHIVTVRTFRIAECIAPIIAIGNMPRTVEGCLPKLHRPHHFVVVIALRIDSLLLIVLHHRSHASTKFFINPLRPLLQRKRDGNRHAQQEGRDGNGRKARRHTIRET